MRLLVGIATLLLAFATGAAVKEKYPSPDDPAAQAAARAALGGAKILDIVGMARGIESKTRGIESVLKDLGAKVTDQEIRIELAADVLFDFDKHDLRPEAVPSLEKVAEVLRSRAASPVTIEGHTDGKGNDAYNQPLSEKRAQAVRDWLVKNGGASAARITTRGWGKSKPIVPNTRPDGSDDPEGRKKNRRVEIAVRTGSLQGTDH
jgi:outer membrane protein OmpA-like peptidoglycan-associated protein